MSSEARDDGNKASKIAGVTANRRVNFYRSWDSQGYGSETELVAKAQGR